MATNEQNEFEYEIKQDELLEDIGMTQIEEEIKTILPALAKWYSAISEKTSNQLFG